MGAGVLWVRAAVPAQLDPSWDRPPELGAIGVRAGAGGELIAWLFRADYSQYATEQARADTRARTRARQRARTHTRKRIRTHTTLSYGQSATEQARARAATQIHTEGRQKHTQITRATSPARRRRSGSTSRLRLRPGPRGRIRVRAGL